MVARLARNLTSAKVSHTGGPIRPSPARTWLLLALVLTLSACAVPAETLTRIPASAPPSTESAFDRPSAAQQAAFASLRKVDPYPLYIMRYAPAELPRGMIMPWSAPAKKGLGDRPPWGCTLIALMAEDGEPLVGRNFDWQFSPALLLVYQPPGGIPSVSMVDLAYFFDEADVERLENLDPQDLRPLLDTYQLPFDGMNAEGLVVVMAAVPDRGLPDEAGLESLDSLAIIRRILDQAPDVEAALEIFEKVKPEWGRGPALHYIVSDASGKSALVEFIDGELRILRTELRWQVATNFLVQDDAAAPAGVCWRYDLADSALRQANGNLDRDDLMALLRQVSQSSPGASTQWSIVYGPGEGTLDLVLGRDEGMPLRFQFDRSEGELDRADMSTP